MKAVVRMVAQRHESDCGVAALAMFLGISYEDALLAFEGEGLDVMKKGVWWSQLKRAASRHGVKMVIRRKWSPTDEGILEIKYRKQWHVVLLKNGHIFDTDYRVWALHDFYGAPPKAPFGALLVRSD